MTKKEPLNFNVPGPLKAAFAKIAKRYSEKRKWSVCGAAILFLLEQPEAVQHDYITELWRGDADDASIDAMIKTAEAIAKKRVATPATSPPLPPAPADASEPATAPDETIVHRTGTGETTKALSRTPPQPQTGQGKQAKPGRKPHGSTV